MMSVDPVILSYQDSLLRLSDVTLLDPPFWLNDHVIGFTFEYFAFERFKDFATEVCFIGPEVAQFIKCATCQEELSIFLEPLDLSSKKLVILAVNDNSSQSAGGTHWSLLVYIRPLDTFNHYDTYSGSNSSHAKRAATKLEAFVKTKRSKIQFVDEPAPAQQNSYDCGMYVICIAEALCEELLWGRPKPVLHFLTPDFITQKRVEWKRLIKRLAIK
ncbi:sentrin-specific protease 8 [Protopterus annectens]|uniref:sentrin-specific protease 8 n=1 Tax=Protopterus annectens TaxID=7888 RepID=UPI001CFA2107|nr:sentrin-specific protease 8 [Protopterus annectens]XP_043933433.1 sentrin-specific protease 8 [Protopterus annectens]